MILADDVLVERRADGLGIGDQPALGALLRGGLRIFLENFLAEVDALVADIDPGTGHQLADLRLVLAAEGAARVAAAILAFVHRDGLGPSRSGSGRGSGRTVALPAVLSSSRPSLATWPSASRPVLTMMSSMMPYSLASWALMKKSRSVSRSIFSIGCPVCVARMSLRVRRMRRISWAWIWISVAWPWKPPDGWWIRIRVLGRAKRMPFVPPASNPVAMLAA